MNSIPIINNTGVHFNIYNRSKTYMYIKYYGLKSIGFFFQFHIALESMNFTLILKWKAAKDFNQNETKKFFFVFQFHENIFFFRMDYYTQLNLHAKYKI